MNNRNFECLKDSMDPGSYTATKSINQTLHKRMTYITVDRIPRDFRRAYATDMHGGKWKSINHAKFGKTLTLSDI